MSRIVSAIVLLLSGTALPPVSVELWAQGHAPHHHSGDPTARPGGTQALRRVSPDELHRSGGVPRGWVFSLPQGNPANGRQVFADLECYKCHAIKGEGFPAARDGDKAADGDTVGPELTGMGGHHPAEYFAESILAPNAIILDGAGYTGPDGLSKMPSYADALTVTQLIDLVAYLKSLTGNAAHRHHEGATAREQVAGEYRIRLRLGSDGHQHGAHRHTGAAGHGTHGAHRRAHLMVFVSDKNSGEPVPYLPVTATIRAAGAANAVKLAPMMGADGFHYGADVVVPSATRAIVVSIGVMQLPPSARARFDKPLTVTFDWSDSSK